MREAKPACYGAPAVLLWGRDAASECPILRTPKHCCLIPGVKRSTLTSDNCERR
jgi:hypothetical protein